MTLVETVSMILIIVFVFSGIVLSIFPRVRHKQQYPKYKRSGKKYLPKTGHYAKRKK